MIELGLPGTVPVYVYRPGFIGILSDSPLTASIQEARMYRHNSLVSWSLASSWVGQEQH